METIPFPTCKKDSQNTTPSGGGSNPIINTQNNSLIGIWVQDSIGDNGNVTRDSSISLAYNRDTIYIAAGSYYESMWLIDNGYPIPISYLIYTWQTTVQDSLIINYVNPMYPDVTERYAYKYAINGKMLSLATELLTQNSLPPYNKTWQLWQYYYHRIK